MQERGNVQAGADYLLRTILKDFEALARQIDSALESLTADDPEAADIERLQRAKAAAQKGAALARSRLSPDP